MADDEKTQRNPLGHVGDVLRKNLRDLREARGLSYRDLSALLEKAGRPIPPLGLSRIEKGSRRVDADDLVALAVVLNTSPAFLLTPADGETVCVVPAREDYGIWVGAWLRGETPLPEGTTEDEFHRREDEFMEQAPLHKQATHRMGTHPVVMAIRSLETFVRSAVLKGRFGSSSGAIDPPILAESLRREADRVSRYVHLLADEVETGAAEDRPVQYPSV